MNAVDGRPFVNGVTIDGPYSRDLDDAIWLTRKGNGWILDVSIADVASGIPLGSPYDIEARKRGFTRYYASSNDPMVPRELSENKLSLLERQERNTITVSIPIADDMTIGEPTISETRLVSKAKLSYELVDVIIRERPHVELYQMLNDCNNLANLLLERRRQKGALVIYDIYSGWRTMEDGSLEKILPQFSFMANIIIQEFMILTNEMVARFFAERDVQAIFRNHTARTVGADRKSLLADFSKSVANPKVFRIETLRDRVSLSMNRATYDPVIKGHFGLNLPAYLHFTSPIRRYADLVCHRLIIAILRSEPLPYTSSDLENVSQEMTLISFEIKDKAREREAAKSNAAPIDKKVGELQEMQGLKEGDFTKLTEMAATSSDVSPELSAEVFRRCDRDTLLPRDAQVFLLEGNQAHEAWIRIKKKTFKWLLKHPEHAITIFNLASQKKFISELPTYTLNQKGPDHTLVFEGTGSVVYQGTTIESQNVVGSNKKHAQQLVCTDLLASILLQKQQIDVEYRPTTVSLAPIKNQEAASGACGVSEQNSKNRILELCQKFRWQPPGFTTASMGPDHAKTFGSTATIEIKGTLYKATGGTSNSKKDAEKLAADALLKTILSLIPAAPSEVPALSLAAQGGEGTNYVSTLQEFLTKNKKASPDYAFKQSGPPHTPTITCTCTLEMSGGQKIVRTANGPSNKISKQRAAEAVLKAVEK